MDEDVQRPAAITPRMEQGRRTLVAWHPFLTIEGDAGRTETPQKMFLGSLDNQFTQAELNLKRWNKDKPLLSISEALIDIVRKSDIDK